MFSQSGHYKGPLNLTPGSVHIHRLWFFCCCLMGQSKWFYYKSMRQMEGRQSLSLSDSPGTVAPTGIRQCGVPGADKGISWRRSSDSGWRVCLSNNTVDTGVNAAVTPLFEFECTWHESACMCEACTARVALTLTEVKIKYGRSDTSAAPWCLFWRKKKSCDSSGLSLLLSKPAYPRRYKIGFFPRGRGGRITRLVSLWEEPVKGHTDRYEGQPIDTL